MGSMAIQAHRGSPDPAMGIRENTLDAFLRAGQLGADGVELDVRMTSDGALAIHHDPIIAGVGPISGLAAGELPDFVPLLAAALDACHGLIGQRRDQEPAGRARLRSLRPRDPARSPIWWSEAGRASSVVISSFWPPTLEAVRDADPDLATGLLLAPWFDPAESVAAALARGCTAIHPHLDLVDGEPGRPGPRGRAGGGRVDGERSVRPGGHGQAAGADTVITDDVAVALATLGRR